MFERILSFLRRIPLIKNAVNYFAPPRDELEILRENFLISCDNKVLTERHLQAFEAFVDYYQENLNTRSQQWKFVNWNPVLLLSMDFRLDNYAELFKILQRRGFDFNAKMIDDDETSSPGTGNNALLWMIANGNNDAGLQFLKFVNENSLGFEIDHQDSVFKNTALILAAAKDRERSLALMEKLIELGANPNIQNENGDSALDIAAARRDLHMMAIILKSPLINDDVITESLAVLEKDLGQNKKIIRDALCSQKGEYKDCLRLSKEVRDEVLQDEELKNKARELMTDELLKKNQPHALGSAISVGNATRLAAESHAMNLTN